MDQDTLSNFYSDIKNKASILGAELGLELEVE